jgi:hypothetical protein
LQVKNPARIPQVVDSSLVSSPKAAPTYEGDDIPMNDQLNSSTETLENPSEATLPAQVFISEAAVAFSTAAAVPVRRAKAGWRTRVALAVRTVFGLPRDGERRPPRQHPQRLSYLEDALMAREMDRL